MAENENALNEHQQNGNNNNNNNTILISPGAADSASARTVVPLFVDIEGRSESDATHIRLRDDRHPTAPITCLSCGETFASSSLLQVYEHYGERVHPRYYASCLYCGGKVHQYCHAHSPVVHIYHNCLRWKRGEDK